MIRALVERLYAALAAGDTRAVQALLASAFIADFTPSLPDGVGGRHDGSEAIDRGWWALGRAYAVRADPEEYVPALDGRLLVLGRYRGRGRRGGSAFEAVFAHLWTAEGERLTRLVQITDAAPWLAARATQGCGGAQA
jgi:2-(1,2-epoxy-1,2-dihydrophenyl)acetyl-CoA isomerase